MIKLTPQAVSLTLLLCMMCPVTGRAATDDIANLKAELEALKSDYNSRVQALESRIKQLEDEVAAARAAQPGQIPPGGTAARAGANAPPAAVQAPVESQAQP